MTKPRILIVEDERITAMDERGLLEEMGYEVTAIASSVDAAVQQAERTRPDLVLMDIMLDGGGDGIQAGEIINRRRSIPIVYVTAHADHEVLERAMNQGSFGYVVKPFTPEVLRTNIELALYKHRADQALREQEQFLRDVTSELAEGLLVIDEKGRVLLMNPEAERLLGWTSEELGEAHLCERVCGPAGKPVALADCRVLEAMRSGEIQRVDEDRFHAKDGRSFPVAYSASPMIRPQGTTGVVLAFHDISQRKQAEQQLAHLASHDTLTGVLNRSELESRLDLAVQHALEQRHDLSLCLLDVDNFKQINDGHGHQVGDRVLRRVAEVLRAGTRDSDGVGRYGGDEFVVVFPNTPAELAGELAERLRSTVSADLMTVDEGRAISLTISIGVAGLPAHGTSKEALLAAADKAMYRAKASGRDRVCVAAAAS